ncbi:hypothetical protein LCGC14_1660440 [marine sediment metagenome]|uniref:Uncharacterized protein n=1 Tax=marine sediment metagenome TaxID=412755 RepID=A0A0F9IGN6_9ZZZZ
MPKYYLTVTPHQEDETVAAGDLEVGQLAMGVDRDYAGILFLRAYDSVVSLSNPQKTWNTSSCSPHFRVRPLRAGTVVKLTAH